MIRLSTFVWPLMIILAAFSLFKLKHSVQTVTSELVQTQRKIENEQKAIDVLKGEWSMLNRTPYLTDLVRKHIPEGRIGQSDLGTLSNIPSREMYDGTGAQPVAATVQLTPAPIEIPVIPTQGEEIGSLRHIQEPDLIGDFLQNQNLVD